MGHHSPEELLSWFHWEQLIVPSPYQVALIDREGIHILHTCLRLLRTDLADVQKQFAKKSLNCFLLGSKVNRQFSVSFAFELTPGQWSRCTENWTSVLFEFHEYLFRDMIPNSLRDIHFHWIPFLLGTSSSKWPLSYTKLLRKFWVDLSICQTCFFIVFLVAGNVVEHRYKWNSFCESFCCFSKVAQ